LTPAGEAFVESARLVLRDLSVLYASVKAVEKLRAGTLDVAAPQASAAELLARLVGEFRSRHPGVRVRIQTSENLHDMERYVRTGRCEVALTVEAVEPPLVAEVIGHEEHVVIFPPGTKLKRRPLKHAELAGLPMIVPTGVYEYYGGLALQISSPDQAPVVAVETESRQALIPLVLAGAGFTFLPRALAEGATRQGVVIAELDPPMRRDIRLVTRPGPLSPAAKVFVTLARASAAQTARRGGA
jgi:DNA-binding transcriptional LysR family regulator